MRVTIENVNRMVHELIPTKSDDYTWQVDDVKWTDSYYHFICERRNGTQKIDYVCKLTIVRNSQPAINGTTGRNGRFIVTHLYNIKIDENKTIHYLTQNEIRDMNKVMEKFADILNRIPK